eukprot:4931118-Pyramimonas_sp.AAC.1
MQNFRAAAAFGKSSMHGSQFSVASLKTVRKNGLKQVTQANANSGFLLDMSDLIANGSTVSCACLGFLAPVTSHRTANKCSLVPTAP